MLWVVALAASFLSFSNGANDNFKGFATVWGSRALRYRSAIALATLATLGGSIFSLFLADELIRTFSGTGLVPDDIAAAPPFLAAVAFGAALTVIVATHTGFPISTTHALIGGMVGSGLALAGASLDLQQLAGKFLLPLLFSPILAGVLGLLSYKMLWLVGSKPDCLCLTQTAPTLPSEAGTATVQQLSLVVASQAACADMAAPVARVSVPQVLDKLHILSAASICFARSLNDTPKLAALLLGAKLGAGQSMIVVAIAMAAGGLLMTRRVAETMSLRLNQMDAAQGVSANLITAALVLSASKLGLPVSTTHVSVGSIAGVGAGAGTTDWRVFRTVLLSWAATLPAAAVASFLAAALLRMS